MMLSRPIASGAMLVVLIGAVGGAMLQPGSGTPEAGVADVQTVETGEVSAPAKELTEPAAVEADAAPEPAPVEVANVSPPARPAGLPYVSPAERDMAVNPSPVVTVNGRPLGAPDAEGASPRPVETASVPVADQERTVRVDPSPLPAIETQTAAIEPPLPQPRPQDMPVREAEPFIDYDAIANAAYEAERANPPAGQPQSGITFEQRQALAPIPNEGFEDSNGYDPRQDQLVGVVGPNGEVIWIHEDQVRNTNQSRVNVQRTQRENPFGFVYDELNMGW